MFCRCAKTLCISCVSRERYNLVWLALQRNMNLLEMAIYCVLYLANLTALFELIWRLRFFAASQISIFYKLSASFWWKIMLVWEREVKRLVEANQHTISKSIRKLRIIPFKLNVNWRRFSRRMLWNPPRNNVSNSSCSRVIVRTIQNLSEGNRSCCFPQLNLTPVTTATMPAKDPTTIQHLCCAETYHYFLTTVDKR